MVSSFLLTLLFQIISLFLRFLSVGSMGGIIPRTSQLNLDVRLSVHPASETLSLCFCSCAGNRDRIRVLLQGYPASNSHDFHLRGANVLFIRL